MRAHILDHGGLLLVALILGGFTLSACTPSPVYHHRSPRAARAHPMRKRKSARPARVRAQKRSSVPAPRRDLRSLPRAVRRRTARPIPIADIDTSRAYQIGIASYYGKEFQGRPTASGAIFDMYRMTAAHRVLPLGTRIRVTNLSNGRWVDVEVNDRGPFVEGRILDLSYAAALELEMVAAGTARVMIELLGAD